MSELRESDVQRMQVSVVESSGLFDREWYVARYPEACEREDALGHFCREGWRQGFQPNPYFHTAWYAKTYGAEFLPDENPLLHYIRVGERENAWPSPHFDPEWYRAEYTLAERESPLRHYLRNRGAGTYSPLPGFDAAAYAKTNPECLAPGQDPYLHWLQRPKEEPDSVPPAQSPMGSILDALGGSLEHGSIPESVPWENLKQALRLLIPFIPFDDAWYCRQYPDVANAVKCGVIASAHEHFVTYGFFEGRYPSASWRADELPEPQ